mmetsp:Transcript_18974/g.31890  ORF Transcript_18974/g.31890 Transcript_18974/m.31890 type:complete len:406 (-) Transcript_18974:275-1492(-)
MQLVERHLVRHLHRGVGARAPRLEQVLAEHRELRRLLLHVRAQRLVVHTRRLDGIQHGLVEVELELLALPLGDFAEGRRPVQRGHSAWFALNVAHDLVDEAAPDGTIGVGVLEGEAHVPVRSNHQHLLVPPAVVAWADEEALRFRLQRGHGRVVEAHHDDAAVHLLHQLCVVRVRQQDLVGSGPLVAILAGEDGNVVGGRGSGQALCIHHRSDAQRIQHLAGGSHHLDGEEVALGENDDIGRVGVLHQRVHALMGALGAREDWLKRRAAHLALAVRFQLAIAQLSRPLGEGVYELGRAHRLRARPVLQAEERAHVHRGRAPQPVVHLVPGLLDVGVRIALVLVTRDDHFVELLAHAVLELLHELGVRAQLLRAAFQRGDALQVARDGVLQRGDRQARQIEEVVGR